MHKVNFKFTMWYSLAIGFAALTMCISKPSPDVYTSSSSGNDGEPTTTYNTKTGPNGETIHTYRTRTVTHHHGPGTRKTITNGGNNPSNGGTITYTITITPEQQQRVDNNLSKLPNTKIHRNPNGQHYVTIPGNHLYSFLKRHGVPVPDDRTALLGPNGETQTFTIYLSQIYRILSNKHKLSKGSPTTIFNILQSNPGSSRQTTTTITLSQSEKTTINNKLENLPNTKINTDNSGKRTSVTIPANTLYTFLQQQGIPLPDDMSTVPGFKGKQAKTTLTITLDTIYSIISNKKHLTSQSASNILQLLVNKSTGGAGGNGNQKGCKQGAINGGANALESGINNGLNGVASGIVGLTGNGTGPVGGAIKAAELGKTGLLTNAVSGANEGIQDAACGLGDIADIAASAFNNGDLVGGAEKAGERFVNGVGDIGKDLVSQAGQGLNNLGNQITGLFG